MKKKTSFKDILRKIFKVTLGFYLPKHGKGSGKMEESKRKMNMQPAEGAAAVLNSMATTQHQRHHTNKCICID